MRSALIGCFCAGVAAVAGCADGSGTPTSPSVASTTPSAATTGAGIAGTARHAVLLITKTCDTGDHCTVITSSSGPLPVGTDVNYLGPLLESRTTSSILVTTPAGDTAEGHCSLSYKSGNGTCVILGGTGALAGLRANVKVSSDFESNPAGVFTWEGPYHFQP